MAKSELIALLSEGGVLRGVRLAPRGRDGWARTGEGEWSLTAPAVAEDSPAPASEAPMPEAVSDAGTVAAEDTPEVRAFSAARRELGANQVVLGLPLSSLITHIFRVPVELRDDLQSTVELQMEKLSPFTNENQTVGYEILSETEENLVVFAAAMPQTVADGLEETLSHAKLNVVRIDAAVLGWYRALCGPCDLTRAGRQALLVDVDGTWELLLIDHGVLVLARTLAPREDAESVARELLLSLLYAESTAGARPLERILFVSSSGTVEEATKQTIARDLSLPAEEMVLPDLFGGVEGIAYRATEAGSLDLTPQAWRDAMREQVARRRVAFGSAVAASIALVGLITLFTGPMIFSQMTKHVRKESSAHRMAYKRVSDMRERVRLIETYMDRTKSPLEMLRLISENLPEGITLTSVTYKRADGVKISGEADQPTSVYTFKNAVTENPLFQNVTLTGPSASRGKHKFDIHATFQGVEEAKK